MSAIESVESFRERARVWLADNMPLRTTPYTGALGGGGTDEEELAEVQKNRDLQRKLFDGGFAGICFPIEYGGLGLTSAHADAFNEEIAPYEFPEKIQVPTFAPCASVLLEFGTEEQKLAHIPAILKGEEIWMQFLSEPSGGSDVAGAQTTAVRDGDEWVLSGSKIWTTGAWWSDWGLCLARTNWDVPKHRGLTVFILQIHQPGIEVNRIEMLNGSKEFCQEYIDEVRIPDSDRIGAVDEGWTVGTRWMFYEKSYAISPLTTRPSGKSGAAISGGNPLVERAKTLEKLENAHVRNLIGESIELESAYRSLSRRVSEGIRSGAMSEHAAALTRVLAADAMMRTTSIEFEISGSSAVAWTSEDVSSEEIGNGFLMRQSAAIGGGTTEMSRNVISERILGMPRELTHDKDLPFRDVPRGPSSK